MQTIAFFDTKPYDTEQFDRLKLKYDFEIKYFEYKLNADTAYLARGCDAACAFVNDDINAAAIDALYENGITILAMRCAGYNNVDFKHAYGKVHIVRVPAYSPHAVAEHAMALLLTLNRHTHRAYIRTRDFNFSLSGMTGFDLAGKTMGVVGTGKVGRVFLDICKGFQMDLLAYDPYPADDCPGRYVPLDELLRTSDVISLHCPLTPETHHMIDAHSIATMKDGVYLINTSRGGLIDTKALLPALRSGKIGGVALDVYEEETDIFFEDFSAIPVRDEVLALLVSMPNVLITSHQAFLTWEALAAIAEVTLENLRIYFDGKEMQNEVCYYCEKQPVCNGGHLSKCF